jgi:hypothetical protein
VLTTLQGEAYGFLHGAPKGVTYEEITVALQNYCVDHLEEVFHTKLKRRTQCVGESLQEFATVIAYLAHVCMWTYQNKVLAEKPPLHLPVL